MSDDHEFQLSGNSSEILDAIEGCEREFTGSIGRATQLALRLRSAVDQLEPMNAKLLDAARTVVDMLSGDKPIDDLTRSELITHFRVMLPAFVETIQKLGEECVGLAKFGAEVCDGTGGHG